MSDWLAGDHNRATYFLDQNCRIVWKQERVSNQWLLHGKSEYPQYPCYSAPKDDNEEYAKDKEGKEQEVIAFASDYAAVELLEPPTQGRLCMMHGLFLQACGWELNLQTFEVQESCSDYNNEFCKILIKVQQASFYSPGYQQLWSFPAPPAQLPWPSAKTLSCQAFSICALWFASEQGGEVKGDWHVLTCQLDHSSPLLLCPDHIEGPCQLKPVTGLPVRAWKRGHPYREASSIRPRISSASHTLRVDIRKPMKKTCSGRSLLHYART